MPWGKDLIKVSSQQSQLGGPLYGNCRLCDAWFALLLGEWQGQHEVGCPENLEGNLSIEHRPIEESP